jgi:hypothetical protein
LQLEKASPRTREEVLESEEADFSTVTGVVDSLETSTGANPRLLLRVMELISQRLATAELIDQRNAHRPPPVLKEEGHQEEEEGPMNETSSSSFQEEGSPLSKSSSSESSSPPGPKQQQQQQL